MPVDLYLTFVIASVLIIVVPGPTNLVIVSATIDQGVRRAAWTIYGAALAHLLLCAAATFGLAVVMAISSEVFEVLRWLGVGYLVALGIYHWRDGVNDNGQGDRDGEIPLGMFARGFLVTVTNPKALLFYGAFFPPFVATDHPLLPQLVALAVTHVTLFVMIAFFHAAAADRVRLLLDSGRFRQLRNKVSAGLFLTAAVLLATTGSGQQKS